LAEEIVVIGVIRAGGGVGGGDERLIEMILFCEYCRGGRGWGGQGGLFCF